VWHSINLSPSITVPSCLVLSRVVLIPMPSLTRIGIVGGGLGGLALAQHLKLLAPTIAVTVFERDTDQQSRSQGYYIGLNDEGVAALADVQRAVPELDHVLSDNINRTLRLEILNAALSSLLRVSLNKDSKSALVNRWALRQALTTGVDIQWAKRLVRYTEDAEHVHLSFDDGSSETVDFAVGCDGSRSQMRSTRSPGLQVDNVGIANIGGTVDISALPPTCRRLLDVVPGSLTRVLGLDGHSLLAFLYRPTASTPARLLWSVSWPVDSETHERVRQLMPALDSGSSSTSSVNQQQQEQEQQETCQRVCAYISQVSRTKFTDAVADTVAATPSDAMFPVAIVRAANNDNPDPLPEVTRVTLLGDALHPMTTHAGLGANTAFVDAHRLANALVGSDWRARVADYQADAYKRGYQAVRKSRSSTSMIHARGSAAVFRNVVVWLMGCILAVVTLIRGY
jgi:2-polyprenyl-6-methoxyphenol hydroxylase-like FAD-dependent oxidoreductase